MFPECQLEASQLDPVKAYLANAFGRKLKGDAMHYDVIVEQLNTRSDEDMLWKILIGLCSCSSQLTSQSETFRDLIKSVLSYNWSSSPRISAAYLNLLVSLVSSNATFLIPCLDFLVKSFSIDNAESSSSSSSSSSAQASTSAQDDNRSISSLPGSASERDKRYQQIHFTLGAIIRLAPTGQTELFPMLAKRFPHKRFSLARLAGYVQHLLRICSYLPVLQPKILDLIVLKCLEIDVEIVIEDTGEVRVQEEVGGQRDEMFLLDEDPDMGRRDRKYINQNGSGSGAAQCSSELTHQRIPPEVAELADKLDAMLALLLQYIEDSRGSVDAEERLFHQLLNTFEERVLVTHRSKFVQFILFHFSGRSERFACALAGRLLRCFEDHTSSPLKQQSAVLYQGSFLARAKYLPQAVVSETLSALLHWCSNYVASVRGDSSVSLGMASALAAMPASMQDGGGRSYIGALLSKPLSSPTSGSTGSTTSSASGQSETVAGSPQPEHGVAIAAAALPEDRSSPVQHWSPPQRRRADVTAHETFYYAVQAVLYIYCFHGVELSTAHQRAAGSFSRSSSASSSSSSSYIFRRGKTSLLQLERCLSCSLDPMRFCLTSVRSEFLRLALHSGLLSQACISSISPDLLPGAAEAVTGATSMVPGRPVPIRAPGGAMRRLAPRSLTEGSNPLDTFFPFDPCLLR